MVMEVSKNILGCRFGVTIEETPEKANIDSWFLYDSSSGGTRKRRNVLSCQKETKFMSIARNVTVIEGLKHVLRDSLDCRFNDVS